MRQQKTITKSYIAHYIHPTIQVHHNQFHIECYEYGREDEFFFLNTIKWIIKSTEKIIIKANHTENGTIKREHNWDFLGKKTYTYTLFKRIFRVNYTQMQLKSTLLVMIRLYVWTDTKANKYLNEEKRAY